MRFTMPSRILANLLLPEIEEHLDRGISAFSPLVLMYPCDPATETLLVMTISSGHRRISVVLSSRDLPGETVRKLRESTAHFESSVSMLLCISFGIPVTVRVHTAAPEGATGAAFLVDFSIEGGGCLRLTIPSGFFDLFSRAKFHHDDPQFIEDVILAFFLKPRACFPRIGMLIECLAPRELEAVFHALRARGRLSAYQVLLLLLAFPGYANRIRAALPDALVREGLCMVSARRLSPTRRDLAGGVYSVDEALYRLLMGPNPPGILKTFRGLRALILELRLARSLPEDAFWSLCETAAGDGTLYEALSLCGERITGIALAGAPRSCIESLRSCVSGRTVEAIVSAVPGRAPGLTERSEARTRFETSIRKARVRRLPADRRDIAVLLSRLTGPADHEVLLLDTGWFLIATALKGVARKTRGRFLAEIASPARHLIQDVLGGTVNPDILHDEHQVRRAGEQLCDRIIELYERGLIGLSG
jgi:hypothetical protein